MNYTPEEIAELLKERPNQPHYIAGLVRRAVEAEREACARVCDEVACGPSMMIEERHTAKECERKIRARGCQK
jgi:hypothetical protein